jgi:hypothetical protein
MFSVAVRSSSRRKSWNTMPSRRRSMGMSLGRRSLTLAPETRTSPEVGCCSAYSIFMMVDFPAPECPVRKTNSPLPTRKDTSLSARAPLGYDL